MSVGVWTRSNGQPLLRPRRSSTTPVSARCRSRRLICAGEYPHTLPMNARTPPQSVRPSKWRSNFTAVLRTKAWRAALSPSS